MSKKTLKRVESIKNNAAAHLNKTTAAAANSLDSSSGEEEEEEEKTKEKELLAKTLQKYYLSLGTSDASVLEKESKFHYH